MARACCLKQCSAAGPAIRLNCVRGQLYTGGLSPHPRPTACHAPAKSQDVGLGSVSGGPLTLPNPSSFGVGGRAVQLSGGLEQGCSCLKGGQRFTTFHKRCPLALRPCIRRSAMQPVSKAKLTVHLAAAVATESALGPNLATNWSGAAGPGTSGRPGHSICSAMCTVFLNFATRFR
jgi:hypothetical protein